MASDNQGLASILNVVVKANVSQTRYQRSSKLHCYQPVWNVLHKQTLYNSDIVCNEKTQDDDSVLPIMGIACLGNHETWRSKYPFSRISFSGQRRLRLDIFFTKAAIATLFYGYICSVCACHCLEPQNIRGPFASICQFCVNYIH